MTKQERTKLGDAYMELLFVADYLIDETVRWEYSQEQAYNTVCEVMETIQKIHDKKGVTND